MQRTPPKQTCRNVSCKYTVEQEDFAITSQALAISYGSTRGQDVENNDCSLTLLKIIERDPHAQIGYFVFGKKAAQEARKRREFNATNVSITTTHAFAKKEIARD